MKKKHIYFISESIPHQGFGSFIIFFRHLMEYHKQGYKITLIIPEYVHINTRDYTKDYPKEWRIIIIPFRKWYFLPYRYQISILREIRYKQLFHLIRKKIDIGKSDIILTYFYRQYLNGFASWLKNKFNCKLAIFLHDDKYLLLNYSKNILKYDQQLVAKANIVLTVTNELYIPGTDRKKYLQLFPIPDGIIYKQSPKMNKIIVGFSGTLYRDYEAVFDALLVELRLADGAMHLITNVNEHTWITTLLKKHSNLFIIPNFIYYQDALKYLKENCNLLYCGYPLETKNMKWITTSFPSKLIEYTFLNIPIILSAPRNSSLHKWMTDVDWPLVFNNTNEIRLIFHIFLNDQDKYIEFLKKIQQTKFNPQLIHQKILKHVQRELKS